MQTIHMNDTTLYTSMSKTHELFYETLQSYSSSYFEFVFPRIQSNSTTQNQTKKQGNGLLIQ